MEFEEHELKPVEITTEIDVVEHKPRLTNSFKCDVCYGKSNDGTGCVHCKKSVSNEKLDKESLDAYLQSIKSSDDEVNCKLEGTDCSLKNAYCTSSPDRDSSTGDNIDAKVAIKQETYEDIPDYVSVDPSLLDVKLEKIKEEPTDSEVGLNSNMLCQNEGSNVEIEQGSLEGSVEGGLLYQCGICSRAFKSSIWRHEKVHNKTK